MKKAPFAFSPPGRMLFRFAIDEAAMHKRFGAPHYGANGPRGLPAWGLELSDGTKFELHHRQSDGTCYVNGDLRELHYLMHVLGVDEAIDRLDADEQHYRLALEEHFPMWRAHRVIDANGRVIAETPSPREAAHLAAVGGGQIELEDLAAAEARHRAIVDARSRRPKRPPPPVRAVSSDGTWELWRKTSDGGRSLVGVYEDRGRAEAAIAAEPDAEFDLRPRAAPI